MATEQYRDQVRLLLDVLPLVMAEPVFALVNAGIKWGQAPV